MTSSPARSLQARQPELLLLVLAWLLVLQASLLNFLNFHRYPIQTSEVAVIAGALTAIAVLAGYIHAKAGAARVVMEAALVYLAIDLNFDLRFASAIAIGAAALYAFTRKSTAPFLAVIFMAVFAGQIWTAFSGPPTAGLKTAPAGDANLPAIVHIVLDEHIGVGGLQSGDPAHRHLAQQLGEFYEARGFAVYPDAFSRHAHTISSFPEILNFGESEIGEESLFKKSSRLASNAYFDALSAQGYRINVLQSSFVDFCGHPSVDNCATYPHNDLHGIARKSISVQDRTRILGSGFVTLSTGLTNLTSIYDRAALSLRSRGMALPVMNPGSVQLTMPLAALDAASSLTDSLQHAQLGNVYFAHLLFPHFPHVTTPQCHVKPFGEWSYLQFGGDLAAQFQGYSDQVLCSLRLVDMMLAALAKSPAAKNNVVIIHGDHGSRIVLIDAIAANANRIPESDMRSLFSALFVVRMNGEAGWMQGPTPVSDLLRALATSRFRTLPQPAIRPGEPGKVYIADEEWRPAVLKSPPSFPDAPRLNEN